VPAGRGEAGGVALLVRETAAFGLFGRRDDADLVAEFRTFFGEGVDVEAGGRRLGKGLVGGGWVGVDVGWEGGL